MAQLICLTCRKRCEYADLKEIPYRPFCSRRCQLVDLGKWLNEEYRISEPLGDNLVSEGDLPKPEDTGTQ